MHTRTLGWICVTGTLALANQAIGDFVSVSATVRTLVISASGQALDVYELWATFDSPTDRLHAVGGTPQSPQVLESGWGQFYQVTMSGEHLNWPGASEDVALDSFLTIGVRTLFNGPTPTMPVIDGFNLDAFNGGVPTIVTDDGGWYVIDPNDAVCVAVPYPPTLLPLQEVVGDPSTFGDYGVILGQFSVSQMAAFSGDLGRITVIENGVERVIDATLGSTFSFQADTASIGACCGASGCALRTTAGCVAEGGTFFVDTPCAEVCALCAGDLDGSGDVGFADVLAIIAAWGPCVALCNEDLDGSGAVDFADVLAVIASWGPC